jgi:FixJ family two-component response regulator
MLNTTAAVVAVVEDDDEMREAIRRVLQMAGYMTELFDSAEAFLGSGAAARASCLVVDIRLRGASGIELRHCMRSCGNPMPTIFVTAYDDWSLRGLVLDATDACLVKPFPAEVLVQAVHRTLRGSDVRGQP